MGEDFDNYRRIFDGGDDLQGVGYGAPVTAAATATREKE